MSERRVHKFPVGMPNETGRVWMDLPAGAEPLSVGLQENAMVLWALVYADEPDTGFGHRLIVTNTGRDIPEFPEGARFLGTVTTSNGTVWHVWDGDAALAPKEDS